MQNDQDFLDQYEYYKAPTCSETILNDTEETLIPIIQKGIESIDASLHMISFFNNYLDFLNGSDKLKLKYIIEEKLADLKWLDIDEEEYHKAWLLLRIIRAEVIESMQINNIEDNKQLKALNITIDQINRELNYYKEELLVASKGFNEYYDILNRLYSMFPQEIRHPTGQIEKKEVFTLTWVLDPIFLVDLFDGLIAINLIPVDSFQDHFVLAFSGVAKSEYKYPVIWNGSVRLLVYLLDQLAIRRWIKEVNNWPSIVESVELFKYKGKLLKANNLSQVKVQINTKAPKSDHQIDVLLNEIGVKQKRYKCLRPEDF